jgi:hypothetical protein
MAIFTFDDLNEMKQNESEFFGPSDMDVSKEFSPSMESISFIKNYSKSTSIRQSAILGDIRFHLN